jgi:hypothetical protein
VITCLACFRRSDDVWLSDLNTIPPCKHVPNRFTHPDLNRLYRPRTTSDHEKQLQTGPKRKTVARAFGYVATTDFLVAWADRHDYCLDRTPHRRAENALWEIFERLPNSSRRICLVHLNERSATLYTCIVVASNLTRIDRRKALDPKEIELFQKVLMTKERPKWYPIADED